MAKDTLIRDLEEGLHTWRVMAGDMTNQVERLIKGIRTGKVRVIDASSLKDCQERLSKVEDQLVVLRKELIDLKMGQDTMGFQLRQVGSRCKNQEEEITTLREELASTRRELDETKASREGLSYKIDEVQDLLDRQEETFSMMDGLLRGLFELLRRTLPMVPDEEGTKDLKNGLGDLVKAYLEALDEDDDGKPEPDGS